MNRLFMADIGAHGAMLCQFSILVRVGPVCRGATNKYFDDEDIVEKPVPVFCVQVFPVQEKTQVDLTNTGFFRCSLRFLVKKKTGTGFSARKN